MFSNDMYSTVGWEPPGSDCDESRPNSRSTFDQDGDDDDRNDDRASGGSPKARNARKRTRQLSTSDDEDNDVYGLAGDDLSWEDAQPEMKRQLGPPRLKIIRQPEEQHRARYLSEGSRGAIKDRSGLSHCTIQLQGYNRPTKVEIFAGTGSGALAPHSLYRVIAVTGKGGSSLATPCQSFVSAIDGTPSLTVQLRPEYNMTAVLDCVGILKICTYSMKKRLPKTNKTASVRLVFRALVPKMDSPQEGTVIQTVSSPIVCVQQLGLPEVLKTSTQSAPATGGIDLFIIGRNFDRNGSVLFREYKEDGTLSWSAEAAIDRKLLHQCHIVCSVPTYRDLKFSGGGSVEVSMTVMCGKKSSHPIPFYYYVAPDVTQQTYSSQPSPAIMRSTPSMQHQPTSVFAVTPNAIPTSDISYDWTPPTNTFAVTSAPPPSFNTTYHTTIGSTAATNTETLPPPVYHQSAMSVQLPPPITIAPPIATAELSSHQQPTTPSYELSAPIDVPTTSGSGGGCGIAAVSVNTASPLSEELVSIVNMLQQTTQQDSFPDFDPAL